MKALKDWAFLEHGEEIQTDGYFRLPFGGAHPLFMFNSGVRVQGSYASLADVTTGSPTSQSGTQIEFYVKKFPRQGNPRAVGLPITGWPIIKTFEKDLKDIAGEKEIHILNSGNLLRHVIIYPSSGTLLNSTKIEVDDGNDVIDDLPWHLHREEDKTTRFFDAIQPAGGFAAYSFNHLLPTTKSMVGKLALKADINSEANGKVTVVTVERMNPAEEAALVKKVAE